MYKKSEIKIGEKWIGELRPCYFIADIAANHDGNLQRAKDLIYLAKESGADCAKFQHFKASKIVSDKGFKNLRQTNSHQTAWKKSVYEVYEQFELNREWNNELAKTAIEAKIHFMTTPYDVEAVDEINPLMYAWKIGSGDITYLSFVEYVARTNKPIMIATGASTLQDVERVVNAITKINKKIIIMQCNTNYTGSMENFKFINLNVLKNYAMLYPEIILGLSDHSSGHSTVLGAIALGARVIEKHFTDDNNREGPDHSFAMNPQTWNEMIHRSRELEAALGDGIKRVEENEKQTVVVQQRCLRVNKDLLVGHIIKSEDLDILRPAPIDAYKPYQINELIGKKLKKKIEAGDPVILGDI